MCPRVRPVTLPVRSVTNNVGEDVYFELPDDPVTKLAAEALDRASGGAFHFDSFDDTLFLGGGGAGTHDQYGITVRGASYVQWGYGNAEMSVSPGPGNAPFECTFQEGQGTPWKVECRAPPSRLGRW